MNILTNIIGVTLIILGILTLSYKGFEYTKREKIVQIGEIQVTADTPHRVEFPPLLGGLCIAGGVVIVVIGAIANNKKKK